MSATINNNQENLFTRPFPLSSDAFTGIIGRFALLIEAQTESDISAVIVQFIIAFGNVIGRNPYFKVEETKHFTNLFAILVGDSSKGRKGTSWDLVRSLIKDCDPEWVKNRINSGLSSGEGLTWAIRDSHSKSINEGSKSSFFDQGVEDKRLLIIESEFASVLKNFQRDGNTLSPVLRDAWDGKQLQILTKKQEARCSEPHVSVIGHITKQELLRYFTATEMANGFGNRFLWIYVTRSKLLPFGGCVDQDKLSLLKTELSAVISFSRAIQKMEFNEEAKSVWIKLYSELAHEKPGVLGAILARAEPLILRLSLLYALMDQQNTIQKSHLNAAIAIWRYVENSAKYIFGESTGDRLADRVFDIVKNQNGLSQTELINALGNNNKASDIERCKKLLIECGYIQVIPKSTATAKKQVSHWFLQSTNYEFNESTSDKVEEISKISALSAETDGVGL